MLKLMDKNIFTSLHSKILLILLLSLQANHHFCCLPAIMYNGCRLSLQLLSVDEQADLSLILSQMQ